MVILSVVYLGLCVGTFINIKDKCNNKLTALICSLLLPIPVICICGVIAVNVLRDLPIRKWSILVILLCFSMYVEVTDSIINKYCL